MGRILMTYGNKFFSGYLRIFITRLFHLTTLAPP